MPRSSSRHPPRSTNPQGVRTVARRGKTWTVSKVRKEAAEDADFRFWYEGLTPEERVSAVGEALESCLKTRGRNVPRLRRVHRRIERPRGSVSRDRRARGRLSRPPSRHEGS